MKNLIKFAIVTLVFAVWACTPKTAEKVVEEQVVEAPKPKESLIDNPCMTLDELDARSKDEAETAYVLYRDQIKLKNYKEAFVLWTQAFYAAPAANGRIKYQFDDGIKIYKSFYDAANEPSEKKMHFDSIMAIYDKRAECYPEPGYVEGRKAFDMYYYFQDQTTKEETFELFKKALDIKGEKSDYFIINPLTGMLAERLINEEISLDEGRMYAGKLLAAAKYGLANCNKDCEAWEIVNEYAPARLENLEGIRGLYDCAYYEEKYYAELQNNPTDCETINRVYARLLWGGCEPTNETVAEVKAAKATNCYTPPPPEGPLKKAFNTYSEGDYPLAIQQFEDFVNTTTDMDKKAKYTLLIAKIYYGDLKKFSKSRTYALKAAEYRSNWGDPYILIGKLYASSGPLCGPGRGWDSQIVTWPAIDKFSYAKKIDPAVAEEANKWISTYSQYMPSKEDVFLRGLKAGQSFKVPCWIQENTTIRTAD